MRKRSSVTLLRALPLLVLSIIVAVSCASPGTPSGGPKDTTPPYVVKSSPAEGALNVTSGKIRITMNKNVELQDAFSKVIVSPAQKEAPIIRANAKNVYVELRDTLVPNATYTIDFADAIRDLNEGNILDGYALDFSTGNTIDSLRISGMVLEARTLEPAQGVIVGVYSNLADSAIRTLPMERVTKTNQLGQFTVRGLKAIPYRIYAINDLNRNYKWDRSENVAFYDTIITPHVDNIVVTDTLKYKSRPDSLVKHTVPHYLPNDILLTWFNENYVAQYIKTYTRPSRNLLNIVLGTPADSMMKVEAIWPPQVQGMDLLKASVVQSRSTRDSVQLFMRDPKLLAADTLKAVVTVMIPDSLGKMHWKPDTLTFRYSEPKKSKAERKAEEEERKKMIEEAKANGDSIPVQKPKVEFISMKFESEKQDVYKPLAFSVDEPLDNIDPAKIKLQIKRDTLWVDVDRPKFTVLDSLQPLNYTATYTWQPGNTYKLTVDSTAVTNIYGLHNNTVEQTLTVPPLSDYGSIYFNVTGTGSTPAFVELLDNSDKALRTEPVVGGTATFRYLEPGDYYARLFLNPSKSGVYGNGQLWVDSLRRQPDEVYYFPKKINLKKNWDVEQSWDINALPLDTQKPFDLKKNKPKDAVKPKDEEPKDDEIKLPPGIYVPEKEEE